MRSFIEVRCSWIKREANKAALKMPFFASESHRLGCWRVDFLLSADGMQDMAAAAGVVPGMEPKEDVFDPLATPDVNRLNAAYFAVHGRAILSSWVAHNFIVSKPSLILSSNQLNMIHGALPRTL
ncbi:hypothetical protein Droror1_Dr00023428 [Drosera rotundifolia]